jgi:hypothetical protein
MKFRNIPTLQTHFQTTRLLLVMLILPIAAATAAAGVAAAVALVQGAKQNQKGQILPVLRTLIVFIMQPTILI